MHLILDCNLLIIDSIEPYQKHLVNKGTSYPLMPEIEKSISVYSEYQKRNLNPTTFNLLIMITIMNK